MERDQGDEIRRVEREMALPTDDPRRMMPTTCSASPSPSYHDVHDASPTPRPGAMIMARQLDIALIIDLEATCWREGSPPPGQYQEIIEIGIATIDLDSLQIIDKHSLLVTPTQSTISEFCTELTTITPQMVERRGVPLEEACRWLRRELQSPKRLWMSWGDFDRRHVERECARKSIRYPLRSLSHERQDAVRARAGAPPRVRHDRGPRSARLFVGGHTPSRRRRRMEHGAYRLAPAPTRQAHEIVANSNHLHRIISGRSHPRRDRHDTHRPPVVPEQREQVSPAPHKLCIASIDFSPPA